MKWLGWIVATVFVAVAVHVGSVIGLPHLIMARTMRGIAAHGGLNTMIHGKRPTAASRGVVRPSPDLLYSSCVYDLDVAAGMVRVTARGMPKTYWSVSLFDAETNNFYVLNDRETKDGSVNFVIVGKDQNKVPPGTVVRAPTRRGLVLIRTLIDDDAHLADIDKARRSATCAAVAQHT